MITGARHIYLMLTNPFHSVTCYEVCGLLFIVHGPWRTVTFGVFCK